MALSCVLAISIAACGGGSSDRHVKGPSVSVTGEALERYPGNNAEDPEVDGGFAPVLKGKDFAGRAIRIGYEMGRHGQKKAVLFVAHWCRGCWSQVRSIAAWLDGQSLPANSALYLVVTGSDPKRVNYPAAAWLSRSGVERVPTLVDSAPRDAARAFGYTRSPSSPYWVFLDEASDVMGRHEGPLSEEAFGAAIAALSRGDKVFIGGGTTTTTAPESAPDTSESTTTTPPTEPLVPVLDAAGLLGQPVEGSLVSAFEQEAGCVTKGVYVSHIKCLNSGVELSIDARLNVNSVFLYAEGVADYSAYRGQMPLGLAWGIPRPDVEASLGPPVRLIEPTEYSYDPEYVLQYRFDDQPFKTVDLAFTVGDGTPATQLLRRVTLTTNVT